MTDHACPSCGKNSISSRQKLGLGIFRKIPCSSCGVLVSVAWIPALIVTLIGVTAQLFLGILAIILLPKPAGAVAVIIAFIIGIILGTVVYLWLYQRFVPLIVRHS